MTDKYYRVEAHSVSNYDSESDSFGAAYVEGRVVEHVVLKHTPKGAWVKAAFGEPHFVLDGARKRYANPTVVGAFDDFYARKNRHINILKVRIGLAERMMDWARMQQGKL